MKNKKLTHLSSLAVAIAFIGCGGNDNSNNTPTPNTPISSKGSFNYQTELAKAPQAIQDAMNANPIQYVDVNKFTNLNKQRIVTASFNLSSIPKIIDANTGYSFITLKINNEVATEGVYTWDKINNRYNVAFRGLSATDKTSNELNGFRFWTDISRLNKQKVDASACAKVADVLAQGTMSFNINVKKTGYNYFLSNIVVGLNGVNTNKPDFNFVPDEAGLTSLISYLNLNF